MQGLAIRDGSHADRPGLRALWQAAWQASYTRLIGQSGVDALMREIDATDFGVMLPALDERLLVAILDAAVVGSAIFADRENVYLWGMYVHPAHQRRGVGTALLGSVAACVRSTATLEVSVLDSSPWAKAFYLRHGFIKTKACSVQFTADDVGKPGVTMTTTGAELRRTLGNESSGD